MNDNREVYVSNPNGNQIKGTKSMSSFSCDKGESEGKLSVEVSVVSPNGEVVGFYFVCTSNNFKRRMFREFMEIERKFTEGVLGCDVKIKGAVITKFPAELVHTLDISSAFMWKAPVAAHRAGDIIISKYDFD